MIQDCPCRSGMPYRRCCQPLHQGQVAPSAVALMRSRYAAYALGKVSYIMQTQHPAGAAYQTDKRAWRKGLKLFCQTTTFLGLRILADAQLSSKEATVTFHALLQQQGQDASFTEKSLFRQENGRWLYVEKQS